MTTWTRIIASETFDTIDNHKKIQNAMVRRGIDSATLFVNGYFSGPKYDIIENDNDNEIIIKETGNKFDDELVQLLSEELGLKVEKAQDRNNINDTIFKVMKN